MRDPIKKLVTKVAILKAKNLDCLVARFLDETGYHPKDIRIVERMTPTGMIISVKHKNTPYKRSL